MYRFSTKTFVYLALFGLAACSDDNAPAPDAMPDTDAPMPDVDAGDPTDANDTDAPPPIPDGIQDALDAPDGVVDVAINNVWVTYTKPAIGSDVAGFFVQADQMGPALFVAVDPATLTPVPAVGDQVDFTIGEVETSFGLRQAIVIGDFAVDSSGNDISTLAQDVSDATELVSAIDDYTSEYITVTGTITSAFGGAGGGHLKADFDTAAVIGNPDLALRMPIEVADDLNLAVGCMFTTSGTPLWRFNAEAQVHLWMTSEITTATCPAPTVVSAVALSPTEVAVSFDRAIDAASINDAPNQFTIAGLPVSAAAVAGRIVTLTTDPQVGGQTYTVSVAASVMDIFGAGVDAANNVASFTGYQVPGTVRINELKANIGGGCDLIEIRVVAGGSMEGFTVTERGGVIYTFPPLNVATNDFIILHTDIGDTNCNPGTAADETMAKDEYPNGTYGANLDFAWDLYSADAGLTATDNVFEIRMPDGTIADAVLVANGPTGNAASDSESAAADVAVAGQWTNEDGTTPAGGYIDDDFRMNAAQGLGGADTIQRMNDDDNNHLGDWNAADVTATWGMLNVGQADF